MTLTNAFESARNALSQNTTRSSVISRNIAGASDANYTRKSASIHTDALGSASVLAITRAADRVLLATTLDSTSAASAADARKAALDQLDISASDPNGTQSLPTLITDLQNALQVAASDSGSTAALSDVVSSAGSLARGLNVASARVDRTRADADAAIADGVQTINTLLSQFGQLDKAIQRSAPGSADLADRVDARDGLVKDLAKQIGVSMVVSKDGSAALYTDGGATLYERGARKVTFQATASFGPGINGAAVFVDGIPVTASTSPMASKTGAIAGLATFRDDLAPKYQAQLDGVARGLVEAFAEKDQSASPSLPDAPGLFTWSGAPSVPTQPTPAGLAGSITVAAAVDPQQGGSVTLVRDGGISGSAYQANASHYAGFTARIQSLLDAVSAPRGFDATNGAGAGRQSVSDFAASSSAWLASARQSATDMASYQGSLATQATTALSNATGVNLDDEMARMLDVEHSYQTSARLLTTIDAMYTSLFQAMG